MRNTRTDAAPPCSFELELTPVFPAEPPSAFTTADNQSFSYVSHQSFHSGQQLRLRIPSIKPDISVLTQVRHCSSADNGFLLRLSCIDQDQAYHLRMLLQLGHIHHYHQHLQDQGTSLSLNEAAGEWISRFAENFPSIPAFN